MILLVLRPIAGATATAARAHAAGHDAVIAPIFQYHGMPWTGPPPHDLDALLLTSAAAVRFGGEELSRYRNLPVHAVGSATAAAATAAGFGNVTAGDTDARAAIATLAALGHRTILHPAGLDHIPITHPAMTIHRRQVYSADPVAVLPTAAVTALDRGGVALLHSPRAARVFADLLRNSGRQSSGIHIGCFSPAIAASAGDNWAGKVTAERPTDDALFAAVAMLCDQARSDLREPE